MTALLPRLSAATQGGRELDFHADPEDAWCHSVHVDVNGVKTQTRIERDALGFSVDGMLGSDEAAMLKECATYTDTGVWRGLFTYPNCGWVLVSRGWVTPDKHPTDRGYQALTLRARLSP